MRSWLSAAICAALAQAVTLEQNDAAKDQYWDDITTGKLVEKSWKVDFVEKYGVPHPKCTMSVNRGMRETSAETDAYTLFAADGPCTVDRRALSDSLIVRMTINTAALPSLSYFPQGITDYEDCKPLNAV